MDLPKDPVGRIRAIVAESLARHGLRRAAIAFSGGPDSSVLADACAAVLPPGDVVLLHVDHGMPASAAARAHAEAWAAARGLTFHAATIEVPSGASWEAQARRARMRALVALLGTGELVLTAHTASDQAETVLMNVIRGTGPRGLSGIARVWSSFVRPLLAVSRAEVIVYADARGLAPWHDPMNDDPSFTRVRVRKDILPALRTLNPAIDDALCRLAATAAEHDRFLRDLALPLRETAMTGAGVWCAPVAAAPAPIAKWFLATWLRSHLEGADATHLEAVLALARAPAAGTRGVDLPGGRVERVYDHLRIGGELDPAPPPPPPLTIDGPDGPYRVRTWAPGDRMRLRGGSRKLSDIYIDRKVPRAARATARVVERADGTIVWAEHVGTAFDVTIRVDAT